MKKRPFALQYEEQDDIHNYAAKVSTAKKDWQNLSKESLESDLLKRYAPFLSKIAVNENSVIIRDEKLQRLEIIYRDNKFWCDVDEEDCCVHVHFALALPELTELRSK